LRCTREKFGSWKLGFPDALKGVAALV